MEVHFDGACEKSRRGAIATYGYTTSGAGLAHEGRGLAVPPFHPRSTNNVAEYAGAICALEWVVRTGYDGEVIVRGDSQLVIHQMTGEYRVRAQHLKPYQERLRQLSLKFRRVEFLWVPRGENERADLLSKIAIREASDPASASRGGAGGIPPGEETRPDDAGP